MALTRLPSFTLLGTDSYTFGNANVSGNITTGNLKTDHLLYANGDPYIFTTNAAGQNTQVQFNDGNSFTGSANFTFDKTSNTLSVTNYAGNGAGLTSLTGANVTGTVSLATTAGTVSTSAQPNITSVGTLSGLTVSGSTSLGNVGNIHISGGSPSQVLLTDGTGNLSWSEIPFPATTTYIANSISLTQGVYVSGNIESIRAYGDYLDTNGTYVFTDGTAAGPAWQIDVDFTGITTSFNRIIMNIAYTASSGHTIYIEMYNYNTSQWDVFGTYTGLGNYYSFALSVTDGDSFIYNGRAQLRLVHNNSGASSHTTQIDYIGLEQSYQGPQGPRGAQGNVGPAGNGVASGGTFGQLLIKNSSANYDTSWTTPTGTNITVDNFVANGIQTDFTLSVTPDSEAYTMVAMAGTLQPRSIYSVTGNVLTFSSAPPNTAPIEVTVFSSIMGFGSGDIVASVITGNTITANTLTGNVFSSNANLTVNTLSANSITNTGTGIPTINSATSINFTASTVVRTTSSPFQFYNCTSTVRDAIAASNGYVIYNTTTNKLQVYANGTWVDLH